MKPMKWEEKLISFLTPIVWWFDCIFDIKTIQAARIATVATTSILFWVVSDVIIGLEKFSGDTSLLALLLTTLTVCIVSLVTFQFIISTIDMLSGVDFVAKNVVKTPNPNRYSPLVLMCRVILIVFLFWYLYDDDIHMNLLFCFVAPILGVYMLCVESMPKEEKDKRKHSKKRETITAYTS